MIRIRGVVLRTAVFVILCLGWGAGGWAISKQAGDAFTIVWGDNLEQARHTALAGLECQYNVLNGGLVITAHVTNPAPNTDSFKVVFDRADAGVSPALAARVCDWSDGIGPGETKSVSCAVAIAPGSGYRAIRVAAWDTFLYPTCDASCVSAQGTCLIVPDLWTRLSRPDIQTLAAVTILGGLALAALGLAWWKRAGMQSRWIMAAAFLAAALANAYLAQSALRDYAAYPIVLVPPALLIGVFAVIARRRPA